jgi:hypothetical protein
MRGRSSLPSNCHHRCSGRAFHPNPSSVGGCLDGDLKQHRDAMGPAKRAILEPDRLLTAEEVVSRVCEHFGVIRLPYLKSRAAEAVKD